MEVLAQYKTSEGKNRAYDLGLLSVNLDFTSTAGMMGYGVPAFIASLISLEANLNGYDGDVFKGLHQLTRKNKIQRTAPWADEYLSDWYSYSGLQVSASPDLGVRS